MPPQGLIVPLRPIALVYLKPVRRIFFGKPNHVAVAAHLRGNGGRRDKGLSLVAAHNCFLKGVARRGAQSAVKLYERSPWRGKEPVEAAANREPERIGHAAAVNNAWRDY